METNVTKVNNCLPVAKHVRNIPILTSASPSVTLNFMDPSYPCLPHFPFLVPNCQDLLVFWSILSLACGLVFLCPPSKCWSALGFSSGHSSSLLTLFLMHFLHSGRFQRDRHASQSHFSLHFALCFSIWSRFPYNYVVTQVPHPWQTS